MHTLMNELVPNLFFGELPQAPRLTIEQMNAALGVTLVDNVTRYPSTDNWQSNFNGQTLKSLIDLSQLQSKTFAPFGVPEDLFTAWLKPLIKATEQSVAAGTDPDLVAMDNIRIETEYAAQIKNLMDRVTKDGAFDREACDLLCATPAGQAWLLAQLGYFQLLEWQYHSKGQTRLRAMKKLLRSLLQVIANEPLPSLRHNPYRKLSPEGERLQTDEQYLEDCAARLIAIQAVDAFDVRRFALKSPYAVVGASQWEEVPGSELYTARLRHYPRPDGVKANGRTLYLATPMINRSELFDLAPGKSVIEGMLAEGYDVYMVDYGNPGPEQAHLGLSFYGQTVHDLYLDLILERHPKQDIAVMAYCMGGTLFLPYLARKIEELKIEGKPLKINQIVLMTTPVYFDDETSGHQPMRDVIRKDYSADVMKLFYSNSNVPPQTIEVGMHAIQPGVAFSVAEGFYARANFPGALQDSGPFLHWLNTGTRFPATAHREWIQKIFIDNEIWEGKFCLPSKFPELDGQPVNMNNLTQMGVSIFDYRGLRDPIAPVGSCLASERWGHKDKSQQMTRGGLNRTIEKNIGHIFVVSKKLLAEFLEAANAFLNDFNTQIPQTVPAKVEAQTETTAQPTKAAAQNALDLNAPAAAEKKPTEEKPAKKAPQNAAKSAKPASGKKSSK